MGTARQEGLALLETIVAMIVFTVLLSWLFARDVGQLRQVAAALDRIQATRIAQSRLEELRPADVGLAAGGCTFAIDGDAAPGLGAPRGAQRVRERAPGLFEVEVSVSWRPHEGGARRRVRLWTLIERSNDT